MLSIKNVITFLEEKFPPILAYDWDNIGLQIGDANQEIKRMMVTLDVTTPVIDEAIRKDVDLIITHHPFIFSPLKAIDFGNPQGRKIEKLIKHDMGVYAMHTNYDVAPGGMNDVLAENLGLQEVVPFAMIDESHGLGRIGNNRFSEQTLFSYVELIKDLLGLKNIQLIDAGMQQISRVAVIGGSGGKYIQEAKAAGADVLLTGDVTYHTAIDAKEIGLNVIDIGHYMESVMAKHVAGLLSEQFNGMEILQSNVSKNPIETK